VHLSANIDDEGRLITPVRSIGYDTLVIAIGSVSNDFGTPGVKEHAICLDTPEEAQRFNRRLVNACLRAHTQAEPVRPGQLHVAIIGAGATGKPNCRRNCTAPCAGSSPSGSTRSIRQGHQDHPDRSGRSPGAGVAQAAVGRDPRGCSPNSAVETRTGARVTEVAPDGVHSRRRRFHTFRRPCVRHGCRPTA